MLKTACIILAIVSYSFCEQVPKGLFTIDSTVVSTYNSLDQCSKSFFNRLDPADSLNPFDLSLEILTDSSGEIVIGIVNESFPFNFSISNDTVHLTSDNDSVVAFIVHNKLLIKLLLVIYEISGSPTYNVTYFSDSTVQWSSVESLVKQSEPDATVMVVKLYEFFLSPPPSKVSDHIKSVNVSAAKSGNRIQLYMKSSYKYNRKGTVYTLDGKATRTFAIQSSGLLIHANLHDSN